MQSTALSDARNELHDPKRNTGLLLHSVPPQIPLPVRNLLDIMPPAICIECLLLVEANWVFPTPLCFSQYLREEMMYTELRVTGQRSISYATSGQRSIS